MIKSLLRHFNVAIMRLCWGFGIRLLNKKTAHAQCNLGAAYAKGHGVGQDFSEAVKWFSLAAEQGDAFAQFNLGVAYNNGEGVTQDYSEAAKWFRLAAEQGHDTARSNLRLMKQQNRTSH